MNQSNSDLRCMTMHFFFRIQDSPLFGGEGSVGVGTFTHDQVVNTQYFTADAFRGCSDRVKTFVAVAGKVPIEKVTAISRDEHDAFVKEDQMKKLGRHNFGEGQFIESVGLEFKNKNR